jgi:Gram-negative bacterial TonB protein C-terminal
MSNKPVNTSSRVPGFLVQWEPRYAGSREALAVVMWRVPIEVLGPPARLSRGLLETRTRRVGRGGALFSSVLLHVFVVLLLFRVPMLLFAPEEHPQHRGTEKSVIYYDLRLVNLLKSLPSIQSPGAGGKPGRGNRPDRLPPRGSTAFHPKLTIVSNPSLPDNKRQTIIQPASPPDLRIMQEPKLPTVLVGNPLAVPKPRLEVHLQMPHNAPVRQESRPEAPTLKVYAVPSDFPLALSPAVNDSPHLPVPLSSALLASARAPRSANQTANAGPGEQAGDPSGPSGLLVVGVDPSGVARLLALPPGSRYGDFAISPAAGQPGSPGGVPGGVDGGGTGGGGSGGDGSTAVGSGGSGGGGGGLGTGGAVTIAGGNGTDAGVAGSLAYSPPDHSLLPVLVSPQIRKNNLIVFTGPMGGGGLGVYQALPGGKIYTKFLPMPGKSWVLQYCVAEKAAAKSAPRPRGEVVQLDQGLVPPEVLERYDFERVSVPEEKAGKLIVLRGVIQADGSVAELKLYRGVQSEMDQAAVVAFSRWKFKPALRANQPVAVEILVGIPARLPKS